MAKRPRLVLLDAGAVFAIFRFDVWGIVTEAYDVLVPSIVVREEAHFYVDHESERRALQLPEEVDAGRCQEVVMTTEELADTRQRFLSPIRDSLHDGELEALAYLLAHPDEDVRFVSGDGPAIQAVAMVDPDCRVVSLHQVLQMCGAIKPLPHQFGRDFVKRHVEKGHQRRIEGVFLSDD